MLIECPAGTLPGILRLSLRPPIARYNGQPSPMFGFKHPPKNRGRCEENNMTITNSGRWDDNDYYYRQEQHEWMSHEWHEAMDWCDIDESADGVEVSPC